MSFRITTIHAFTCVGEDDEEGVIAFHTPMGWMPMVAADLTRLDQLRPMAKKIAEEKGKVVVLKRFSQIEVIETYGAPEGG